jgi:sporulation protein YlmC with PRC-barrel domain
MTAPQTIRLERLLGTLVVDARGYAVGRIEDVLAEPDGEEYLVTQVVLGPHGRLSRLLAFGYQLPTMRARGLARQPRIRRVPWDWLDLSDPERPRLVATAGTSS